jgi:drug/metabolite transporter (DMT)-like permease
MHTRHAPQGISLLPKPCFVSSDVRLRQPLTENSRLMTRRQNPIAGIAWMLLACALLAGVAAFARYAALAGLPSQQIVFLRIFFGLVAMLPLLAWRGRSLMQTEQINVYIARVVVGFIAMSTWFAALTYITVGEMTAITFLTPLLATAGAAIFLREVVGLERWAATCIGFVGALVIVRPGFVEIGIGTWLALASAAAAAGSTLYVKRLTNRDDPDRVVFLTTLLQVPLAVGPALLVWTWPATDVLLCTVAMGTLGTLGHVCLSRAFASADASLVLTADFSRLPFAVLFGFLMFGELIDLWTWIGAGIIFCASLYGGRSGRKR